MGMIAACFDPHPPTGAPCSEQAPCPISQQCIANRCGGPSGGALDAGAGDSAPPSDGAVDATLPSATDRDGDGVANDMDNCPDLANPDQGDEDADRIGDACDPCPIDASTDDPDGDGVAGICDPHPTAAGDQIVVFDGFHRTLPASWSLIGNVTQTGDDMVLTSAGGNHSTIVPPLGTVANGMIMAAVTVTSNIASLDTAISVAQPYDPETDDGMFCELDQSKGTSAADRFVSLYEALPADTFLGVRALPWVIGTQYRISLVRSGNNYACAFAFSGGTTQTTSGMTAKAVALPRAAISVYNATVSAAWILVVSSP
jgi:thrombospondin type 3 repeat protein